MTLLWNLENNYRELTFRHTKPFFVSIHLGYFFNNVVAHNVIACGNIFIITIILLNNILDHNQHLSSHTHMCVCVYVCILVLKVGLIFHGVVNYSIKWWRCCHKQWHHEQQLNNILDILKQKKLWCIEELDHIYKPNLWNTMAKIKRKW